MEHNEGIAQVTPVDMCVDLGCQDGFMPKHLLNRPEIGSCLDHMGCK